MGFATILSIYNYSKWSKRRAKGSPYFWCILCEAVNVNAWNPIKSDESQILMSTHMGPNNEITLRLPDPVVAFLPFVERFSGFLIVFGKTHGPPYGALF